MGRRKHNKEKSNAPNLEELAPYVRDVAKGTRTTTSEEMLFFLQASMDDAAVRLYLDSAGGDIPLAMTYIASALGMDEDCSAAEYGTTQPESAAVLADRKRKDLEAVLRGETRNARAPKDSPRNKAKSADATPEERAALTRQAMAAAEASTGANPTGGLFLLATPRLPGKMAGQPAAAAAAAPPLPAAASSRAASAATAAATTVARPNAGTPLSAAKAAKEPEQKRAAPARSRPANPDGEVASFIRGYAAQQEFDSPAAAGVAAAAVPSPGVRKPETLPPGVTAPPSERQRRLICMTAQRTAASQGMELYMKQKLESEPKGSPFSFLRNDHPGHAYYLFHKTMERDAIAATAAARLQAETCKDGTTTDGGGGGGKAGQESVATSDPGLDALMGLLSM